MCIVYNQIGSLKTIKSRLRDHNVNDFSSANELIAFKNNYLASRQQIISSCSSRIDKEKETLREEIVLLADFIETCRTEVTHTLLTELTKMKQQLDSLPSTQSNFFDRISGYFQRNSLKGKIRDIENNFDSKIGNSLRRYTDLYKLKQRRFDYLDHNFEKAVQDSTHTQLRDLDRKKTIVEELMPSVYGAIGEQKVVKELELLPDDHILINDFFCSFHPPIYNRQEKDYIKSVQIDHILIAPGGIFLIETKNWSEQSLTNLSLRSPVDQIKRTSFALFKTLNGEIANTLLQHHWGDRKISIKNLIVLINQKPREEFQYVKILTLNELRKYVEYFKPCYSEKETQLISRYLQSINEMHH